MVFSSARKIVAILEEPWALGEQFEVVQCGTFKGFPVLTLQSMNKEIREKISRLFSFNFFGVIMLLKKPCKYANILCEHTACSDKTCSKRDPETGICRFSSNGCNEIQRRYIRCMKIML